MFLRPGPEVMSGDAYVLCYNRFYKTFWKLGKAFERGGAGGYLYERKIFINREIFF